MVQVAEYLAAGLHIRLKQGACGTSHAGGLHVHDNKTACYPSGGCSPCGSVLMLPSMSQAPPASVVLHAAESVMVLWVILLSEFAAVDSLVNGSQV